MFSLVAEGTTGVVVLIAPGLVAQLLFGVEVSGVGIAFGRLLGVALIAVAIACWPGKAGATPSAVHAMLGYNLLAAIYLAYVAAAWRPTGMLLWPAIVEHALVGLLLVLAPRPAG